MRELYASRMAEEKKKELVQQYIDQGESEEDAEENALNEPEYRNALKGFKKDYKGAVTSKEE